MWRSIVRGSLNCVGKQTITGMLCAQGLQFNDWSRAYRLFSQSRLDNTQIFKFIRQQVIEQQDSGDAIIAHMDDTIIKKSGKHIPGTAWRRDPLGPPFHTNFIWGQRFLQISLALPSGKGPCQSRAIPIDFQHCPTPKRPGKKGTIEQIAEFKEQQKKLKLSKQGKAAIERLRDQLNLEGQSKRQLIVSVDGSYTNTEVLKGLSDKVTLIGRIRKDTKLYEQPIIQPLTGRKRTYGNRLPTPEQIRMSDQFKWQKVQAWAAGKTHDFKIKVIKNTLWRPAGKEHILQLIIIKPLGYRLSKGSKILYREPAYLLCSDNNLDLEKLLQSYLWRWEIEVNFREQKSLMGCGQAQVRHHQSCEKVPQFITTVYSLLQIAAYKANKNPDSIMLNRAKWYRKKPGQRNTTGDLINNLRAQSWAKESGITFSSFVSSQLEPRSLKNYPLLNNSPLFYARN